METKMTVKDALGIAYQELAQVNVPAELTFSVGVHVGKAIMILRDCIDSINREEAVAAQAAAQEQPDGPVMELVPEEKAEGSDEA